MLLEVTSRYMSVGLGNLTFIHKHHLAHIFENHLRYPESAKRLIKKGMFNEVKSVMSEKEFDKHFTPPYNPWEQRFCLAPGGDFFAPIRLVQAHLI